VGNTLGGGADDPKRKSATDTKGKAREGGNIAPSQGVIRLCCITRDKASLK
jgi:hypothetical protein